MQIGATPVENRMKISLKTELTCDPLIPLLGIHSDESLIQKDACTSVFIETLLTIARTQKQPKYALKVEWTKKMWYAYTMEKDSSIKKNKIMPLAATQMAVEGLMICEMSQRKTNTVCHHLYVGSIKFNKPVNVTKNEIDPQFQRRNYWWPV